MLYRARMLDELSKAGFASVVSMECGSPTPDLETLSARFPQARFICLHEDASVGECVNVGMRESSAPFVLVLWNDMRLATTALSSRFLDRVTDTDAACLVPTLLDAEGAVLPSLANPAQSGSSFKVVVLPPETDGEKSLFPADFCGIYSREKFAMLGGFDWTMANPYWQRLDFSLRAWLWGEEIRYAQALRVRYDSAPPVEDTTPDGDYGRFWLKCLAPAHRGDKAFLPGAKALGYLIRSRKGLREAVLEFRDARSWVGVNGFRFKQDAARLADLWDPVS